MNKKLIVVWVGVIFIFLILGVYGYVNRDLVQKGSSSNNSISHICTNDNTNYKVEYKFIMNKTTNKIESIFITYNLKKINEDYYNLATEFNNYDMNGITSSMSGDLNNFTLNIKATIKDLIEPNTDLSDLGILIKKIDSYDGYKSNLNSLNIPFNCA